MALTIAGPGGIVPTLGRLAWNYATEHPEEALRALGTGAGYAARGARTAWNAYSDAVTSAAKEWREDMRRLGIVRNSTSVQPASVKHGVNLYHSRRMAYRSARFGRRRTVRRRFVRRRRGVTRSSRTRLPSRFAYGQRAAQGRVGSVARVQRVQPRYMYRSIAAAQVKYADFWVTQLINSTTESGARQCQYYAPTNTLSNQFQVLYPFYLIQLNNFTNGRTTDSIRCLRLDFNVELFAEPGVQCSDLRVSLIHDRLCSTSLPVLSDIFSPSVAYPTAMNLSTDTQSYPQVDERSRFAILYQQNCNVSRGAALGTTPETYAESDMTCRQWQKSLFLRGHRVVYKRNDIYGDYANIVRGAMLFVLQGGAGSGVPDAVAITLRGRLIYTDL